jgi:hypothetical protein
MKPAFGRLPAVALALLLGTPVARADYMDWTASWSTTTRSVTADGDGSGGIAVAANASAPAGSPILAANLTTFSSAPLTNTDSFTARPFDLTLTINDTGLGTSGSLSFHGQFDGTLSATTADIKTSFSTLLPQKLVLSGPGGSHSYTVNFQLPPSPLGPPNSTTVGQLFATVAVDVNPGPTPTPVPPVKDTPEPSTLVLAGLVLPVAGVVCWRRLRAVPTAALA